MSQHRYMHYQGPITTMPSSFGLSLNVHPESDWSALKTEPSQRLKRRLDAYRLNHNSRVVLYENFTNSISENERVKVIALRQRWLESRSKRLSSSKTKNPASCSKEDTRAVGESVGEQAAQSFHLYSTTYVLSVPFDGLFSPKEFFFFSGVVLNEKKRKI